MKIKIELFKNSAYNIIATIIPILFLQIFVYPFLSRSLSLNSYGQMLTLIGVGTMITQVSGIGINNTRIIMNNEYSESEKGNDFNLIALFILILNPIITSFILYICNVSLFNIEILIFLLFIDIGFANMYINSQFSIDMNYRKILISNLFLVLGYIIGILIYFVSNSWVVIFFFGVMSSTLYGSRNVDFWRKGFSKSRRFKTALNKIIIISMSSFMISLITYADRLFLYPLLGAEIVAIYYTSSQFGKLIGMGLSPVSNVLLSFFSNKKNFKVRDFWKFNIINFTFCLLFYFISLFLSEPVINFLYPTISNQTLDYMNLANLGALIIASSSLVQPFILKFCPTKWQMYIQLSHMIVYFLTGYFFTVNWGLLGFCYSNIIAALFRLIFMCVIGTISMMKVEELK